MKKLTAGITSNERIAQGIYRMSLAVGAETAEKAAPGQFVHIEVPGSDSRLLRRPISINTADGESITIVYAVVGNGTDRLTRLCTGDSLDILAPLGNGFRIGNEKKIWLAGGGVGIAPLLFAAEKCRHAEVSAFLGYRSSGLIYDRQEFESVCKDVTVTTDDLSLGKYRFVTEPLAERLSAEKPDLILSCGPAPMLRALKQTVHGVPVQVSMEQRMGCGVGTCYTCTCEMTDGSMKRVCKDGPVFDMDEVKL